MKKFINPPRKDWEALCKRPLLDTVSLDAPVKAIMQRVKEEGDKALFGYSKQFDKVELETLRVSEEEIAGSTDKISGELKDAIALAAKNIEKFHRAQLIKEEVVETVPGVKCWRKSVPVETAGLYIPGGSAPLFSTILMLGIPARIAGCGRVILCTPPSKNGKVNPAILYAAFITGITEVFMVGGAQAIAAMTYGTETIPRADKIFGPGNQFVTKAKELAQAAGTAIDMPAGPSEVLVIADRNANPSYLAADLLSQAEHGPDSQVVMVSDDENIINETEAELQRQLNELPRKEIAAKALKNSFAVLLPDTLMCMDFSNVYAPEHLIINSENALMLAEKVTNAGSVFIGRYSCESAGDYASGTNHTLPTNGYARNYSGVSTESFMKKITFQELSAEGIRKIGPAIQIMAEAEELIAHKNAVTIRLK